jgi:hypothetical protein
MAQPQPVVHMTTATRKRARSRGMTKDRVQVRQYDDPDGERMAMVREARSHKAREISERLKPKTFSWEQTE